jgi:AcrR family transcriptional regulator
VAQGGRRDAILTAARAEFARWGFAGARIDRIATVANVNKQLIFHYFHSKEGLYSAAVSALFAEWRPVPDGGASPSERLRLVASHLVQWLADNPGAARAVSEVAPAAPGQPEDPGTPAIEWLAGEKRAVRAAVEGGQGLGHFRDDADPQSVAEIVASAAIGHALTPGNEGDAAAATQRLIADLSRAMVEYCAWR